MRKFSLFFALCLSLSLVCCSKEDGQDTLTPQKEKIVQYLETSHQPNLTAQTPTSTDNYYSVLCDSSVYRYIAAVGNPNRPSRAEVTDNSVITITYSLYIFTFTNIVTPANAGEGGTISVLPFLTNDALYADIFKQAEMDTSGWPPFEPMQVDMANNNLFRGFYESLRGCRLGDEVESYMSYNVAYGKSEFKNIPAQSPIALFFTIDSVDGEVYNPPADTPDLIDATGDGPATDDDGLGGTYSGF